MVFIAWVVMCVLSSPVRPYCVPSGCYNLPMVIGQELGA